MSVSQDHDHGDESREPTDAEAVRDAARTAWARERADLIGLLERWRDTDPGDDAAWSDILTDTLDVLAVTEEARAALGRPAGEGR